MNVYIDGENFRKGITEVLIEAGVIKNSRELESYPLRTLLEDVLAEENLSVRYYASKIKLPHGFTPSKEILKHVDMIKNFTRVWVSNLESQDISYVKGGSLKVRTAKSCRKCGHAQEVLQEKGVDVRIAADIFEDVFVNREKVVVLMSSDTDLCPVLHKVKSHGAKVIYVCFADRTNRAVSAVADETVAISTAKAKKYGR
jgi:uncharacterized LabA/DUF88 family protein